MKTRPLLSVVIPTWNRAHIVCESIASALTQRDGDVEVIVVDDGSTDHTADLLERQFGTRIKLLRLPRRGGVSAARNAGASLASGELITFLDSDDILLPGKLDAEFSVLERFPEAEAVISDMIWFLDGQPNDRSRFAQNGLLAATQGRVRWMRECSWVWTLPHHNLVLCSITLRRSTLKHLGTPLFAEDLTTFEDWEWQMRIFHRGRVVVLPEVWSHYRRCDDGARPGRTEAGKTPTREETIAFLRDRLRVMERAHWLTSIPLDLAAQFERCRAETVAQLAHYGL